MCGFGCTFDKHTQKHTSERAPNLWFHFFPHRCIFLFVAYDDVNAMN